MLCRECNSSCSYLISPPNVHVLNLVCPLAGAAPVAREGKPGQRHAHRQHSMGIVYAWANQRCLLALAVMWHGGERCARARQ